MESSRIFIQGLPASVSAEDLKSHFSERYPVTDTKFIPHRRIGYVGYRSNEDAAKAVKYYNKSFMRMSRLKVELAQSPQNQIALKPIRDIADSKRRSNIMDNDYDSNHEIASKRQKISNLQTDEGKTGLQEYLEVMQPPSKKKVWENQDLLKTQVSPKPLHTSSAEAPFHIDGEGDNEAVSKKQKSEPKTQPKNFQDENQLDELTSASTERQVQKDPAASVAGSHDDNTIHTSPSTTENHQSNSQSMNQVDASNDGDWLRSRTSRLLGLIDDDDLTSVTLPEESKDKSENANVSREDHKGRVASDTEDLTNTDVRGRLDTAEQAISSNVEDVAIGEGRLFIRNLTYTTTEGDILKHFESGNYGDIDEVHLPLDVRSGKNKGFAYVHFTQPESAPKALADLDGRPFQGRLLHVMLANSKRQDSLDEYAISKLPLKKQQQIRKKAGAASATFNWNSLYMNVNAVISSISDRLGVAKSEILDPTSSDAAVKQAHAETNIIQETKSYFAANGVNLDAFKRRERGDTTILVKNFPYNTTAEDLRKIFAAHGTIINLLMPPSGTIAIIEFESFSQAAAAFGSLAYRKFRDSVLFLEKAPKGLFDHNSSNHETLAETAKSAKPSATDLLAKDESQVELETSTLFVRNLNFVTTTERLREAFRPLDGFLSAKVKTKTDAKKPGQLLSMGFGFLEFKTKENAQAALKTMNNYELDGHQLLIRASHKATDAASDRRREDQAKKDSLKRSKIIIKNLPFEASRKDVRSLFGSYGQLRSVRVPKKFDSSTRGFAFAEFTTAREAENAMNALENTHLLGRRLVLEFAVGEANDPEQEIEEMQRKVGKQADKVALQRLTGTARKRFEVEGMEGLDQG